MEITTNQSDADSGVAIKYAYITRQSGVRGGNPIVAGTRIGVHGRSWIVTEWRDC